ncbi:MAG: hypothetical protein Q9160_003484 [Pyrenula sp. 1 TL-2023]
MPEGESEISIQQDTKGMKPPVDSVKKAPMMKSATQPTNTVVADSSSSPTTSSTNNLPSRTKAPKPQQKPKQDVSESKNASTDPQTATTTDGADKKLSNAEMKKLAKVEKIARRAAEKAAKEPSQTQQTNHVTLPTAESGAPKRHLSADKGIGGAKSAEGTAMGKHHKRTPSTTGGKTSTIGKAGQSQSGGGEGGTIKKKEKGGFGDERNRVAIFGHLYGLHKRLDSIVTANKDVHPAVLALGLQIKEHVICGGNARCAAMLLVFKRVIESYTTPPSHALSRHLLLHLSVQITHLTRHSRPLCTGQANAIRHLKLVLSRIDPSLPEPAAKSHLLSAIDTFISEKITLADAVIARTAAAKIAPHGDVILVYAKSSIVEKTLLEAHAAGKIFRVIVVDSRPLFEGKNLARRLSQAGIETSYRLYTALDHAVREATKVFLGASAMLSNGRLYARVGTAGVAMMAKECAVGGGDGGSGGGGGGEGGAFAGEMMGQGGGGGVGVGGGVGGGRPVIVLCETVKFSGGSMLDGVVSNEIASEELLLLDPNDGEAGGGVNEVLTRGSSAKQNPKPDEKKKGSSKSNPKSKEGGGDEDYPADAAAKNESDPRGGLLAGWCDQPNLQLLNLMYDVTPAEYLDMVITELGCLPPSSVPVVIGLDEGRAG